MRLILQTLIILLLPFSIGFQNLTIQSGHTFRSYKENGVQICENSGGPRYTADPFRYEHLITFRGDPRDEETLLYSPVDLSVDGAGNYYICDQGNHRIAVFDDAGRYTRSFGREGAGPGETLSMALQSIQGSHISIFDDRLQRTCIFHTDGSLIEVIRIFEGGQIQGLQRVHNGHLLVTGFKWRMIDSITHETRSLTQLTSDGSDTLWIIESDPVEVYANMPVGSGSDRGSNLFSRMPFSARPVSVYSPDHGILLTDGISPVIRRFDLTGQMIQEIRLGLPFRKVTGAMKQRMKNRFMGRQIDWFFPEYIGFWHGIYVDDSGYIWLEAIPENGIPESPTDSVMHVVSPNGEYLGVTEMPAEVRRIRRGLLLGAWYEIENRDYVPVAYRIHATVEGLIYP